ncbi:MAG: acyl-ACP desaturase [Deltaproteobacteria bacterium]|nr:acyl-ACP desaturase [Deltaproteobacteria bacterium]
MSDLAQHLAVSHKIEFEDLDFNKARQHGLSPREIEMLHYFADIESQTVHYFLEVSKLKVSRDPELLTFLTMWNYEEYFHSYALTRFMEECGVKVDGAHVRSEKIRAGARFKAKFEDFMQGAIATVFPKAFIALWMFWGALQECLTTQAYEELAKVTTNPVLEELLRRIAKQERRHFAYYYNNARERLEGDVFAQKMVRYIAKNFYAPVGGGVKTDEEGARVVAQLFPNDRIFEVMGYIEKKMALLPGMDGLDCATRWAARVQPMLPPETRAVTVPTFSAAA